MPATHEVFNQAEPLVGVDLFAGNRPLRDALRLHAPDLDTTELAALGPRLGSAEMQAHARLANTHTPALQSHDRQGRRIDAVEFHPSYHALMGLAAGAGLHGTPWAADAGPHAHLRRAAGFMLFTELEPSVLCPISMTYAVTPALQGNAAIHADWAPGLTARAYDPALVPFTHKAGLTMGMGMTEKQGGSDVRANTTRAEPDGQDAWGARYRLVGHKWFFSAPMCDAFLVLAQTASGLSCLFLPRVLPDGSRNALRIQRLKDKLGNKANASSEVEFDGATAWLVGEEGRGVPQILAMGTMTRLDCALGTSGLMRQALSIALHHTVQRRAFGKALIEQPLMRNVLADLALESEAATALALRLAHAFDRPGDAHEAAMARLLTPVAKFWICKRGSAFAQEAMECLGWQRLRGGGRRGRDGPHLPRDAAELHLGRRRQHHGAGPAAGLAQGRCRRGAGGRTGARTRRLRDARRVGRCAARARGRRGRRERGPAAGTGRGAGRAGRAAGAAGAGGGRLGVLRVPHRRPLGPRLRHAAGRHRLRRRDRTRHAHLKNHPEAPR